MEQSYKIAQFNHRKNDTRRKIEYGGLVIKSGLDHEPKDIILGALISVVEELKREPASREIFKSRGAQAFLKVEGD